MSGTNAATDVTVALACQGGGSHAAYSAGVLKAILREQATRGYRILGFSGTSGGAVSALLAWYGQLAAGPNTPAGAAKSSELLDAFWHENAARDLWEQLVNWWSVELQRLPVELRLSPYELPLSLTEELLALGSRRREFVDLQALISAHVSFDAVAAIGRFQAIEAELRAQRRHTGLRDVFAVTDGQAEFDDGVEAIQEWVAVANGEVQQLAGFEHVREALGRAAERIAARTRLDEIEADLADARRALPVLLVGAVNVLSGTFKTFSSLRDEIRVQSVAASATLPTIFRAQEVADDYYWDGLFSQNPPIMNFLTDHEDARDKPDEIWVVQINPQHIERLPTTPESIQDRRARLTGNLSLNQEIEAIEAANHLIASGSFSEEGLRRHKVVAIHRIELDPERLPPAHALDVSSKLDRDPAFMQALLRHGEAQAALFWPVRSFVEDVVNGRAAGRMRSALEECLAEDVVLRFPPRWPEVRGRDAVGGLIEGWRAVFVERGRSSLRVTVARMEAHHEGPAPLGRQARRAEPADRITWEMDWEERGRLAEAAALRPGRLVRLAGTALATVEHGRITSMTIHARDAERLEPVASRAAVPVAQPTARTDEAVPTPVAAAEATGSEATVPLDMREVLIPEQPPDAAAAAEG